MLKVVLMSYATFRFAECHYAEYHYDKFRYADSHYAECHGFNNKESGNALIYTS